MYIFCVNFSVLNFFVCNRAKKLRRAIREDPETHDFVKERCSNSPQRGTENCVPWMAR
jgi:hypothetical protein